MEECDCASASGGEEGARLQLDTELKEEGFVNMFQLQLTLLKLMQPAKKIFTFAVTTRLSYLPCWWVPPVAVIRYCSSVLPLCETSQDPLPIHCQVG